MSEGLDPRMLLRGYAAGIFPMADSRDAGDIFWVEPRNRAIIPLDDFHLSHSLAKRVRSDRYTVTRDRAFHQVLLACADRSETWINSIIERATLGLHAVGHAHSIECWHDGELVGGLYGVKLGRAFFGESMFSLMTDASKVALAWLVARLRVGNFTLLDCQFITPHLASLGATTVDRGHYVGLLGAALSSAGVAGGGGALSSFGAGAASDVGSVASTELPPPEFEALDRLLERAGADGAAGPPGQLIAQLLGHTS
ncbi:leucyl/phenylalanyl-tRNA--protein transferase [Sphingomonas sp. NSE70-1]|uniref:Leucyl/phenylalanyl-tRNA--protein transferase n=1 Tax=Sphingomonas caseinilyticus TaxID=2908205 RepID=A0ABT0RXQ9_9SPHN|nr:leucyl/phenylalanyl-tRNA--protein transferase [Sphingomonas caseinilyticus]MCL6699757.1 leucyl/phenylalanyl-tRNA--protein transferase [Sphingomonas caseinilyticus]